MKDIEEDITFRPFVFHLIPTYRPNGAKSLNQGGMAPHSLEAKCRGGRTLQSEAGEPQLVRDDDEGSSSAPSSSSSSPSSPSSSSSSRVILAQELNSIIKSRKRLSENLVTDNLFRSVIVRPLDRKNVTFSGQW